MLFQFARERTLPPLWKPHDLDGTAQPYIGDSEHRGICLDKMCPRCKLENGFAGRLRKGSARAFGPSPFHEWAGSAKLRFVNPVTNVDQCWITIRPMTWGGPFAIGCWICNQFGEQLAKNPYSRVEVSALAMMQVSVIEGHAKSVSHKRGLELLSATRAVDDGIGPDGPLTGVSETVPRIDRFVLAANCVARTASYSDYASFVGALSVGSQLGQAGPRSGQVGDSSSKVIRQMITALAEPLRERDRLVLRNATRISLAFDERDSVMVVHLRCLVKHGTSFKGPSPSLYECVLGPVRDFGTGWEACAKSLQIALRDACMIRNGRREPDMITGKGDQVDEDLYIHICSAVEVAVADGGPDVQKAMFELSPLAQDAGGNAPLFPNLRHISRDRAHRFRSVQKGTWAAANEMADGFLDSLVTGEQSIARMLETSRKYSLVFERVQQEQRIADPINAALFAKTLRNFAFKDARFDSRSKPLMKLLSALPLVISTLCKLGNEGDDGDRRWARKMIKQFSGDAGYDRHAIGETPYSIQVFLIKLNAAMQFVLAIVPRRR
jgi:hypothetical protein